MVNKADYPFTTLYPNLGVVKVANHKSFCIADIPGLIEGAAEGAGLGVQFLRHLSRTGLLLHVVDMFPPDEENADPAHSVRVVEIELAKYSEELADKPRWLVMNQVTHFTRFTWRTLTRRTIGTALKMQITNTM